MRDIPGYEGEYAVTSCGKIWSYKNNIFLVQGQNRKGYKVVQLCKNGKQKSFLVHRIVALVYVDNPHKYPEVNHKDETRNNNCANNLEWCTRRYNNTYGNSVEKRARITGKKVICIETGETYYSIGEAARKTGIDKGCIQRSCALRCKPLNGIHFLYYDYYLEHYDELKKEYTVKEVYCVQNGKTYRNAVEASKDTGVESVYIRQTCNGRYKSTHGFNFKYIERSVIP